MSDLTVDEAEQALADDIAQFRIALHWAGDDGGQDPGVLTSWVVVSSYVGFDEDGDTNHGLSICAPSNTPDWHRIGLLRTGLEWQYQAIHEQGVDE